MNPQPRLSPGGSALLVVLVLITILSLMLGTTLTLVRTNANTLNQAASWQQALAAAEAGVQQAAAQVQTQFIPLLNQSAPPDLSGAQSGTPALSGTLTTSGEGNVSATYAYVITGTKCAVNSSGPSTQTYFRILSTGMAQVAGTKYVGLDPRDAVVRKLSFTSTSATAVRQVEAWLKPVYNSISLPITTASTISMNNHNVTVDSFKSTDPARSVGLLKDANGNITSYGQPSSIAGFFNSKSVNNANGGTLVSNQYLASIGTNGQSIQANGATVFGDVMTNGGVINGAQNVYGNLRTDFSQTLAPAPVPGGTFVSTSSSTLKGGTQSAPARYTVSSVSLSGGKSLVFDFGADKTQNSVELYITGDFTTKGNAQITITKGVQVKIFVGGNIDLGGNGVVNNNGCASSLSIQGITPADGSSRTASISGNSTFFGTIYAPAYDFTFNGVPVYVGSLVAKTVNVMGNVTIHFDEALSGGLISSYKLVGWFENTRKVP
ncbi:MAG: hypothetical protein WCO68_07230 [Verrucomicrobiota bacterium]